MSDVFIVPSSSSSSAKTEPVTNASNETAAGTGPVSNPSQTPVEKNKADMKTLCNSGRANALSSKCIVVSSVLVIGHKGWIGQMIVEHLRKLEIGYIVPPPNVRPENVAEFRKFLHKAKPSHIFSTIGRTHGKINGKTFSTIDYLEQEGKLQENVRDNLFAPVSLAFLAKEINCHFTYLGTGCIFEYDKQHRCPDPNWQEPEENGEPKDSKVQEQETGFHEGDVPNFYGSSYSTIKASTDQIMAQFFADSVLNLRIRMPITADRNPRNFVSKITSYKRICSIANSMSVLPELIPMAVNLALQKITGTLNLVNPGTISHNEILAMYKEIVDPNFTWQNFSLEEQGEILTAGRSNNFLDTTKLEALFPRVKPIKESVRQVLLKMAKKTTNQLPGTNSAKRVILIDPMNGNLKWGN